MLRNASFHPSFLVPALSHARSGLLSLLDYLEAHLLLSISEADRVSAVLSGGQVRPQAGYDEVPGLGREREQRLYAPVAAAPPPPALSASTPGETSGAAVAGSGAGADGAATEGTQGSGAAESQGETDGAGRAG